MSNYLRNARDFAMNSPNFSNVEGNQYIYHTHTTTVTTTQHNTRLWIQGTKEEEGEFEQYYEVKRADVELNHSICDYVPYNRQKRRKFNCKKKFFIGKIVRGTHGQGSGLMVVGYEGQEAREAWLEDFKRCTGLLSVDSAHLLAISRSKIPLMIFNRALVPARQLLVNTGYLGRTYLDKFRRQLRCSPEELWMDPHRGVFCRGPKGPAWDKWGYLDGFKDGENVPSSVELLREDVCRRFLTGFKSKWADRLVVGALGQARRKEHVNVEFTHPTVIYPLTNIPIASRFPGWCDNSTEKYGDLFGNGLTRFTLNDPPAKLSLWSSSLYSAWLSQAWSIFHARGISIHSEDSLGKCKLINPCIGLKLSFEQSDRKRRRRRRQPIFLWIRPLHSTLLRSCTTSSVHYWSFDNDGQSPLSADMCRHLGLPVTLELKFYRHIACAWSNDDYKTIHEYQVARGFDPRTTDFARSLGHPAFKLIRDDYDRFKEADVLEGIRLRAFWPLCQFTESRIHRTLHNAERLDLC